MPNLTLADLKAKSRPTSAPPWRKTSAAATLPLS